MVQADANLLRTAAQASQEASRIAVLCEAAQAPKAMIEDAQANSLNAGILLNLAVMRWLKSL